MATLEKRIRDLIHFYVKENYKNYLEVNQLVTIPDDIPGVVDTLYKDKKATYPGVC